MVFSNTVRILLTGLLVVVNYLLLEANLSHTLHVVLTCVIIFAGAIGINAGSRSNPENEVKI